MKMVGVLAALCVAALAGAAQAAAPLFDKTEGAGRMGPCTVEPPLGGVNFCFPIARDFAFSAHQRGFGERATGFYTQRPAGSSGPGFRGEVTCLNVVGEKAVFGGVARSNAGEPVTERLPFVIYVVDNGNASDGDPPDLISPLGVFPQDDPDRPLLPQGFPNVCPPPFPPIYGYLPVTDGNIVVEDQSRPGVTLP